MMHISNYSGTHLLGPGHPLVCLLSMAAFIPQQNRIWPWGLFGLSNLNHLLCTLQEKFGVLWTSGVSHFVLTYSHDVQVSLTSYWVSISVLCCLNPNWPRVLLFLTRSDQYLNSWRFWAIYHLHGLGCYNFDFALIMVTVIPRKALKALLHSRPNLSHLYCGKAVWTNQAYW